MINEVVLNTFVTPNVEVHMRWSGTSGQLGTNKYLDPDDGDEWEEQDLSMAERGHVYRYAHERNGGLVVVIMPYRCFDFATYKQVKVYPSFTPYGSLWGGGPMHVRTKPYQTKQTFALREDDFNTFRNTASALGWTFIAGLVDTDSVVEAVVGATRMLTGFTEAARALRTDILGLRTASNAAETEGCSVRLTELTRQLSDDVYGASMTVQAALARAEEHQSLLAANDSLRIAVAKRSFELARETAQVVDLYALRTALANVYAAQRGEAVQNLAAPLSVELGRVQSLYPVTRILSSNMRNELIVDLGTAKVVFDGGSYIIEGDLSSFLAKQSSAEESTGSSALGRLGQVRRGLPKKT